VTKRIPLAAGADAPGQPFPSDVAVAGGRVFVSLANLEYADLGGFAGWIRPAGNGKLAVIDTARGDELSFVDLGPECGNAGALALRGSTLWVACGSFSFPDLAPGRVVPVDVAGAPLPGAALDASAVVPGGLAFCGAFGYVTDQASGTVLRFDPAGAAPDLTVAVCPTGPFGYAWAADLACAP
jgi:hypothetical protein